MSYIKIDTMDKVVVVFKDFKTKIVPHQLMHEKWRTRLSIIRETYDTRRQN